jgi:polysaccharide biosynthesis protein PslG
VRHFTLALRPVLALGLVARAAAALSIGVADETSADRGATTALAGVNYHPLWAYRSTQEREATLDRLAADGVEWVRIDLYWSTLEPRRGRLDAVALSQTDAAVAEARARGLRMLAVLWGTPSWASGVRSARSARSTGHLAVPPRDVRDFARVAGRLARPYRGRIAAWELWNEPNKRRFFDGTARRYVELLRAAYPLVHPHAQVVFGGLSRHDVRWLRSAYEAGARGSFDVLATHPYPERHDAPPEGPAISSVGRVRALMLRWNDPKPIWFTELGWSTYQGGVSEPEQADYLRRSAAVLRNYPYVRRAFWFTLNDWPVRSPWLANLGLLRPDGTEKPALETLRRLLRG